MKKQIYLSVLVALMLIVSGVLGARAQCTTVPTGITVGVVSCTSANATWSPLPGVTGYEYVVTTSAPSGSGTATSSSSISLSGLTPSTVYMLYVRTECTPGAFSPWASPITFVTPACTCAAPTGFTVGPISCDSIAFVWSTPSGASGIEYVVNTSPTDPTGAGTPAYGSSQVVGGLSGATVYYVHIRTVCGSGMFSTWSTLVVTTPPCPVCPAPTGFTVGPWSCDSIVFVWPFPGGYTNWEYVVDLSPAPPTGAGTPVTGSVAGAGGLMPLTVYYVHVRTNCGSAYSSWTTMAVTTPACAGLCPAPTTISVTPGTESAVISWVAVTGVAGYEYKVSTTPGIPTGAGTAVSGTSVTAAGLTPGTPYYVYTRSSCTGGGYSEWTTAYSFSTTPTTGIGTAGNTSNLMTVLPNPANGMITISVPAIAGNNAQLEIIATDGRTMKQVPVKNLAEQIQIADLPTGMYIIKYTDAASTQKTLLQKN